jgi:hypothetical protein
MIVPYGSRPEARMIILTRNRSSRHKETYYEVGNPRSD